MFALLKIRLRKIRRQPVKKLFLYFFPFFVFITPILFLFLTGQSKKGPEQIIVEEEHYTLFGPSLQKFHTIFQAFVICEDDIIRTSFVHFFRATCSLEYGCEIFNFTSYDSFSNNSTLVNGGDIIFLINGTKSNITFSLISNSFKKDSIEYSANLFNYNNPYTLLKTMSETERIIAEFTKSINELPIDDFIKVNYASYPVIKRQSQYFQISSFSFLLPLIISLVHVSVIFNFFFWMLSENRISPLIF